MRLKTQHAFASFDLYFNWKDRVPIPFKVFHDKYACEKVEMFYAQVLFYCIFLILCDIIENNITFMFPFIGNNRACFYVKCFEEDEFRRLYKKGKFNDIDYLKTEFKGYQIFYQWKSKNRIREKPIYITNNLKERFHYNINQGKEYY